MGLTLYCPRGDMKRTSGLYPTVAALLFVTATAAGQQSSSVAQADSQGIALARHLLSASGAAQSVDAMTASFRKQMATLLPGFHPEAWDSLGARIHRELPALQDSLAPLYAARFTLEELQGLVAFFESPLGRRFVSQQPALVEESSAMSQRWVQNLTKELTKAAMIRPAQKLDR